MGCVVILLIALGLFLAGPLGAIIALLVGIMLVVAARK